jgi:hypothetical protein
MPPRLRGRGLADLGRALDERKSQSTNKLVLQHNLAGAIPAPLSASGLGGGGIVAAAAAAPVYSVAAGPVVLHCPAAVFTPVPQDTATADGATAARTWHACAWPAGAQFAPVSGAPRLEVSADPAGFGLACARFTWTCQPDGVAGIATGSAVGLGFALAKVEHAGGSLSGRAVVRARLCADAPQRLSRISLVLNDVGAGNATPVHRASADVLPGLSTGQWAEVVLSADGTNISAWGSQLRAGLIAYGAESADGAGTAAFSLEWLRVELWRE